MLLELNTRWSALAKQPPASKKDVQAIEVLAPPQDYLELIAEATEIELESSTGEYLRIWSPSGVLEMNEAYEIRKRIPSAFPIGDDGGGRVLMYCAGCSGWGLYTSGYGDLAVEDAKWVSESLRSLIVNGEGIENLA